MRWKYEGDHRDATESVAYPATRQFATGVPFTTSKKSCDERNEQFRWRVWRLHSPSQLHSTAHRDVRVESRSRDEILISLVCLIRLVRQCTGANTFCCIWSVPVPTIASDGFSSNATAVLRRLPTLSTSLWEHSFVAVLQRELESICQSLYQKTPHEVYRDRDYLATKRTDQQNSNNQRACLPMAILHADLFLENILFQGDGEVDAIVDWRCISIGERLIDVTMTRPTYYRCHVQPHCSPPIGTSFPSPHRNTNISRRSYVTHFYLSPASGGVVSMYVISISNAAIRICQCWQGWTASIPRWWDNFYPLKLPIARLR